MRWFYDPGYDYGSGLPGSPREVHGFVLRKPTEIFERLVTSGVVALEAFERPVAVDEAELRLVHAPELVEQLRHPASVAAAIELSEAALLPEELVLRAIVHPQLLAAGGTCAALRAAAEGEWAINLSGGFHHARRNLSHGFCLVNDVALAVERLRREGRRPRVAIVDLDLHQGDGNASMFSRDEDVYTVSLHEEALFPVPKMKSDLDVGLESGTDDASYLGRLDEALTHLRRHFQPEIVVYVAGSDPFEGDPLGSLELSREGLVERDRRVARFAAAHGCALVVLPAGGYSRESPAISAEGFRAIAEEARAPLSCYALRHSDG